MNAKEILLVLGLIVLPLPQHWNPEIEGCNISGLKSVIQRFVITSFLALSVIIRKPALLFSTLLNCGSAKIVMSVYARLTIINAEYVNAVVNTAFHIRENVMPLAQ